MLTELIRQSALLLKDMREMVNHPLYDGSARIRLCYEFAVLSVEHSIAVRCLLAASIMPSAPILLRCQYESLLRAMWVLYCAPEGDIDRLGASLMEGPHQANAHMLQASKMLDQLEKIPIVAGALNSLREFQEYSWKPLNSYVHAGDHPLWRQATGYPPALAISVLKQSNALMMVAGMQLAILTGIPGVQRTLLPLNDRYRDCLPRQSHRPAEQGTSDASQR